MNETTIFVKVALRDTIINDHQSKYMVNEYKINIELIPFLTQSSFNVANIRSSSVLYFI